MNLYLVDSAVHFASLVHWIAIYLLDSTICMLYDWALIHIGVYSYSHDNYYLKHQFDQLLFVVLI